MKLLTEFVLKGSPITRTAQQKGERVVGGKIHHFKKKAVKDAEAVLRDQLLPYVPSEPYEGPLFLRVMWLHDKQSLTKKMQTSFKTTSPDLDNMLKGLADVMTDMGFWVDDRQLAKVELTKAWSKDYPGTFVQIIRLKDGVDYEDVVMNWRGDYE